MNAKACVDDYIRWFRKDARNEMRFYSTQLTLSDAIGVAASSHRADGKRHLHQRRLRGVVLREAKRQLLSHEKALSEAQNFADLYALVESIIAPISGIGELAVYDITHRIGAFLGFKPDLVYLHAGTRAGASALGFSGRVVAKEQLPDEFAPLTAAEIEDCLCIYKDAFGKRGLPSASCSAKIRVSACSPRSARTMRGG